MNDTQANMTSDSTGGPYRTLADAASALAAGGGDFPAIVKALCRARAAFIGCDDPRADFKAYAVGVFLDELLISTVYGYSDPVMPEDAPPDPPLIVRRNRGEAVVTALARFQRWEENWVLRRRKSEEKAIAWLGGAERKED